MENYNSQAFTPEEVKKGTHLKFIKYLLDISSELNNSSYFDIHITTDGYCTIIEWCDYSPGVGCGKFEFVDGDEVIMKEFRLPDGTYQYIFPENEEEVLKEFLDNNPGWVKTEYGTWTNEIENEAIRKKM